MVDEEEGHKIKMRSQVTFPYGDGKEIVLYGEPVEVEVPNGPGPHNIKVESKIDMAAVMRQLVQRVREGKAQLDLFRDANVVARSHDFAGLTDAACSILVEFLKQSGQDTSEYKDFYPSAKALLHELVKEKKEPYAHVWDREAHSEQMAIFGAGSLQKEHEIAAGFYEIPMPNGDVLKITLGNPKLLATTGNLAYRVAQHLYGRARQFNSQWCAVSDREILETGTTKTRTENLTAIHAVFDSLPKASFEFHARGGNVQVIHPFFSTSAIMRSPNNYRKERILVCKWNRDFVRLGVEWLVSGEKLPNGKFISIPAQAKHDALNTQEMLFQSWLRSLPPPPAGKVSLQRLLVDVCRYSPSQLKKREKLDAIITHLGDRAIEWGYIQTRPKHSKKGSGRGLKNKFLTFHRVADGAKAKPKRPQTPAAETNWPLVDHIGEVLLKLDGDFKAKKDHPSRKRHEELTRYIPAEILNSALCATQDAVHLSREGRRGPISDVNKYFENKVTTMSEDRHIDLPKNCG